ncbi:unnamed protein product [Pedinophyceae sp. YPF-701]|nr:unnamed protein product [Pedinophyceae sp. YPF-701]
MPLADGGADRNTEQANALVARRRPSRPPYGRASPRQSPNTSFHAVAVESPRAHVIPTRMPADKEPDAQMRSVLNAAYAANNVNAAGRQCGLAVNIATPGSAFPLALRNGLEGGLLLPSDLPSAGADANLSMSALFGDAGLTSAGASMHGEDKAGGGGGGGGGAGRAGGDASKAEDGTQDAHPDEELGRGRRKKRRTAAVGGGVVEDPPPGNDDAAAGMRAAQAMMLPGGPNDGEGRKRVVRVQSESGVINDGFKWRKYGQKQVKGSHFPRSYYKCTAPGCMVRKHVERDDEDPSYLVTTYDGAHTHEAPKPTVKEPRSRTSRRARESSGGGEDAPPGMPPAPAGVVRGAPGNLQMQAAANVAAQWGEGRAAGRGGRPPPLNTGSGGGSPSNRSGGSQSPRKMSLQARRGLRADLQLEVEGGASPAAAGGRKRRNGALMPDHEVAECLVSLNSPGGNSLAGNAGLVDPTGGPASCNAGFRPPQMGDLAADGGKRFAGGGAGDARQLAPGMLPNMDDLSATPWTSSLLAMQAAEQQRQAFVQLASQPRVHQGGEQGGTTASLMNTLVKHYVSSAAQGGEGAHAGLTTEQALMADLLASPVGMAQVFQAMAAPPTSGAEGAAGGGEAKRTTSLQQMAKWVRGGDPPGDTPLSHFNPGSLLNTPNTGVSNAALGEALMKASMDEGHLVFAKAVGEAAAAMRQEHERLLKQHGGPEQPQGGQGAQDGGGQAGPGEDEQKEGAQG